MNVMPVKFLFLFLLKLLMVFALSCISWQKMSPLGWHHPGLEDHTDTEYLGDQYWQQCWCFTFCFFFVSIYLSMFQSVCVFLHLFRINLKFFKTRNYWLGQTLYVSLVLRLEWKTCRIHLTMLRNSSKKHGRGLIVTVWTKKTLQELTFWLLLCLLSCINWQQWALEGDTLHI